MIIIYMLHLLAQLHHLTLESLSSFWHILFRLLQLGPLSSSKSLGLDLALK